MIFGKKNFKNNFTRINHCKFIHHKSPHKTLLSYLPCIVSREYFSIIFNVKNCTLYLVKYGTWLQFEFVNFVFNCFPLVFPPNDRPLHISAPRGMIEVTEILLSKGCSVTAVDSRGFTPAIACAPNEDTAICLALIMQVAVANPGTAESFRKSISSIGKKATLFCFILSRLVECRSNVWAESHLLISLHLTHLPPPPMEENQPEAEVKS